MAKNKNNKTKAASNQFNSEFAQDNNSAAAANTANTLNKSASQNAQK
ncbi:hypothetical protein ACFOLF_09550 [Paenibacillus sepulcri]|uniref:Small, acid-soluble spore protein gamma-type n=1 Tax=Paenibacillus sepulcri TaxID=359917 RepID=A0ABS7C9G0_9BACL|nr:hypothetical protein [Paenibacillus sepulcri]